jgi:hypothetical protein
MLGQAQQTEVLQTYRGWAGTKIAIGVGIVIAVVATIVVAKADNGPTGPIMVF